MNDNRVGARRETRPCEAHRREAEERQWIANKIVSALLRTGSLCDVVQTDIPPKGRSPDTQH
jgi:hypothetical protein